MDTQSLSEQDISSKFILPALTQSGWDLHTQIREQKTFTAGRIMIHGKTISRGERKRADFILYYKQHMPIAIVEAKDAKHSASAGLEQAKAYAQILGVPFAYSTNGEEFVEFDSLTGKETTLALSEFPTPEQLFLRYTKDKQYTDEQKSVILQDYYEDPAGKEPRYYQEKAVNGVVEAIARGQNRILLVMATGTGKTYTAFQIIYRLWKAK
jgi:type I restriction enzyme R subunit